MSKKEIVHRKKLLRAAVLMTLGVTASTAYALTTTNNNFTMLDGTGALVGGTNDVVFTWDGSLNTDPNTAVSNASISSVTPFFGLQWTAHNVKIYGPGTYTLSTVDTLGSADCPAAGLSCVSAGNYNVTVGTGQVMAHMKFAWGATQGIDVVDVWRAGSWTTLNPGDTIFTGPGGTYTGPVYALVSIDWDGDGDAGAGMIDGPFPNFSANFTISSGCDTCVSPPETNVTASEPSTASGCSISPNPIDPLKRSDWWLVTGFLAWLGALRVRFKRQAKA